VFDAGAREERVREEDRLEEEDKTCEDPAFGLLIRLVRADLDEVFA